MLKYGTGNFPYCTIMEKSADDVQYIKDFWLVEGTQCHPVRRESMYSLFFLAIEGF